MNCIIEFYATGSEKPSAVLYQEGNASPEGDKGNIGINGRLQLLEMMLSSIKTGNKVSDPEWAAAEYVSLFRSLGQGHISIVAKRKPEAVMLYKVYCTPSGLRHTCYNQSGNGISFVKQAS